MGWPRLSLAAAETEKSPRKLLLLVKYSYGGILAGTDFPHK